MKQFSLSILLASVASASSTFADTNKLENITVTGTRSEQPTVRLPAHVQVISPQDISRSGVSSVVQLLSAQAGIQIKDNIGNGGRGASVSMRGFGENSANNVLVLVDGRKLNNPSLSSPDLASIALADIERVEIIHGSAGALYGDQATGGVINIITKTPEAFGGAVSAGLGSDGLRAVRGSLSHAYDSGISMRLAAERKEADNYRDNNEAQYTNVFANVAYATDRADVFLEYVAVNDDLRLPGALSLAAIAADRRQTNTPNNFSNQNTDTLRVGGEYRFSDAWALAGEYTSREAESAGVLGSRFIGTTEVETFNPRVLGDIATDQGNILITAGLDVQKSDYNSTFFTNFGNFVTDSSQEIADVYAQVIYPLTEAMQLTVGGRLSDLEDTNNSSGVVTKDDASASQIGVSYAVDNGRIFLRRDESFRWANADENGFTQLAANQLLKPQQSVSWELGADKQFANVALSAMVYELSIDDEIFFDPSAGFFGANVNLPKSKRTGGLISAVVNVSEALVLSGSYSVVDASLDSGVLAGNTVPFVAEDTAKVQADYDISSAVSLYINAEYFGGRFNSGDEANTAGKLGGYTVLNANIRWQADAMYANLRANNLTGKEYEGFRSLFGAFPAPEATFELNFGYTF